MKKTILKRLLALTLAILCITLVFVACQKPEKSENGFCTIVIEGEPATEYRVDLDKVTGNNGLLSVLEYLKAEEGLSYAENSGFLTEVGSVKQDAAAGQYLYIWTSVEKDFDVSVYASTMTYGDLALTSAGIGAKDMTITDGATIYIGLYSWS